MYLIISDLLCLNDERIDFQSLLQAVSDSCQSSNGIPFSKTSLTVTNGIDFVSFECITLCTILLMVILYIYKNNAVAI